MTTITLPRAVAEQMLGMLLKVEAELKTYYTTETEEVRVLYASITTLRAALAQQALQEPVGRVVSANCEYATVQWLKQTSDVGGGDPKNSRSWPIAGDAVYTAPPQRKPLSEEEIKDCLPPDAVRLPPGWAQFARAVERAHGIGEGA